MNLSYYSSQRTATENAKLYGFDEDLKGISFGAAIKIYLSH